MEPPAKPEPFDWATSIARYLHNFLWDYDKAWIGLTNTLRYNSNVRVLRLPVPNTEREHRFVYRGASHWHIPLISTHLEKSIHDRWHALEAAGVFLHVKVPRAYYSSHVLDEYRGDMSGEALMIEFMEGCKDGEMAIGETAAPNDWFLWSEWKRRRLVRQLALHRVQCLKVQRDVVSGGSAHPVYDYMGGFQNMGTRGGHGFETTIEDQRWGDLGRVSRCVFVKFF